MHAQTAQWKLAACDTWEVKVIPPRGALKANLQHRVKVIFYLTENMAWKELPCLTQGTSEQWFISFFPSIRTKTPTENTILPTGSLSYWDWEIKLGFIHSLCASECTLLPRFQCFWETDTELWFSYLIKNFYSNGGSVIPVIQSWYKNNDNKKKKLKWAWCLERANYSQTDNQATLNHKKPLNFGNESELNPASGTLC